MNYRVVTPAVQEPVTLAEARLHLRLADDQTSDDPLIETWLTVAREFAEHYTSRALAPQTLEMAMDRFPAGGPGFDPWTARNLRRSDDDGAFELVMPPIASITSIKYTDATGAEQTLDPSKYALSPYGAGVRVYPSFASPWPVTQSIPDAVRVRYDAGYGRDGGPAVPQAVRAAILLMTAHLFENRQEVITDNRQVAIELPQGAQALLDTVKKWGF